MLSVYLAVEKPTWKGGRFSCLGYISSHNLTKPKHVKLTKPYTAEQHLAGAAVQSNKVYPPPLNFRVWLASRCGR
jgi:hypothetical protein